MEGDRTNGTASDGRGNLDGGEQARDPDRDPGADSGLADIEPHADWSEIDDLSDLNAIPQRDRLIRVMEKAGWVQAKAARILGLTPRQVGYALRKHNIPIKRL